MSHFGGVKVPKSQQPSKNPYTLYYPHTQPLATRIWTEPYHQFISIDPAIKNLAIRVERRHHNGLIVCLFTKKWSPWQVETIKNGKEEIEVNKVYENINRALIECEFYLSTTHYVLIERQLPENYQATRVAQHLLSYFIIKCQDQYLLPSIIEVDPKLKGKQLGAAKGMNKMDLKKWSVEKAIALCELRKDFVTLKVLQDNKKKDDLADVLCQIEAFCAYCGLSITQPVKEIKTQGFILHIV